MAACCEWFDFFAGLRDTAAAKHFPLAMVDMTRAKRLWKRGYAGHEAFYTIAREELSQASDLKNQLDMDALAAELGIKDWDSLVPPAPRGGVGE